MATLFWAGMMLFSIEGQREQRQKRHRLLKEVYSARGRVFFRSQLFSASLSWSDMLEQLKQLEDAGSHISLPAHGAFVAARVRTSTTAGLVDLNRLLRQATVRRNVVAQLIRMRRDMGHPDYIGVDMQEVEKRAEQLATTDEPVVPSGLVEFLDEESGDGGQDCPGVDKAATPAERVHSEVGLR